jgi:5-formyltetrahydrofolate cyclo-ligase
VKDSLIGEAKRKLRRTILKLRNKLSLKERQIASRAIARKLSGTPEYHGSKTLMFYANCGSEVITDGMIAKAIKDSKRVVLPAVKKGKDSLCAYEVRDPKADCIIADFGIRQPDARQCARVTPAEIGLVIVPGVAFDETGARLGFGKGYYDRWLRNFSISKRIGVCFERQLVKKLPLAGHDALMGSIITEKRVIKAKPLPTKKGVNKNV